MTTAAAFAGPSRDVLGRAGMESAETRGGGCARPVRLASSTAAVNKRTSEVGNHYSSTQELDGFTCVKCGNRRATVCPSCSAEYNGKSRAPTWSKTTSLSTPVTISSSLVCACSVQNGGGVAATAAAPQMGRGPHSLPRLRRTAGAVRVRPPRDPVHPPWRPDREQSANPRAVAGVGTLDETSGAASALAARKGQPL